MTASKDDLGTGCVSLLILAVILAGVARMCTAATLLQFAGGGVAIVVGWILAHSLPDPPKP